jgi:hypothetical protein
MNKRFSGYGLNSFAPIKDLNEEDASFDKNITIFQHNKNVDVAPKDDWEKKHPFKESNRMAWNEFRSLDREFESKRKIAGSKIKIQGNVVLQFLAKRGFHTCRLVSRIKCIKDDFNCNNGYKYDYKNAISYSINDQEIIKVSGKVMDVEAYIISLDPSQASYLNDQRHEERDYSVMVTPIIGSVIEF